MIMKNYKINSSEYNSDRTSGRRFPLGGRIFPTSVPFMGSDLPPFFIVKSGGSDQGDYSKSKAARSNPRQKGPRKISRTRCKFPGTVKSSSFWDRCLIVTHSQGPFSVCLFLGKLHGRRSCKHMEGPTVPVSFQLRSFRQRQSLCKSVNGLGTHEHVRVLHPFYAS